ncbi:MAG: tetratricopeptide repeat protein [bacterium]|nr:tetratricopeptide repeat protein [bacterium]
MNKYFKLTAVLILCFAFLHSPLFSSMSSIKGSVKDVATGQMIGKAKVTLIYTKNKNSYDVMTDSKGAFYKTGLLHGVYRISISKEGFVPYQTSIRLAVGQKQVANITLEPVKQKVVKGSSQYVGNAQKLMAAGKFDAAIAQINKAIEKDPENFILFFNRALGFDKKGDKEKAVEDYKKSLEFKADFLLSLTALGNYYAKKADFEKAVSYFQKAYDKDLGDTVALYNFGACLVNLGKSPEAKAVFEKIISIDPEYPDAYYQLGILLLADDAVKAKEYLKKLIEIDPENPNSAVAKDILKSM